MVANSRIPCGSVKSERHFGLSSKLKLDDVVKKNDPEALALARRAYPVWHQRGFPILNERAAQS